MLNNTVNNNSIFNTTYAGQHGQQQLYLQYKVCWTTQSTATLSSIQSMLDNTVNNNSIFNTKYAGFSAKWWLWQPILCIKSPPKIRFSTSVNFHFPIPLFLVQKIILKVPTNTPFHYTSVIDAFPYFCL